MKHDCHIHTYFSGDSDTKPAATIEKAISLGLKTICVTEHHDMDFPDEPNPFLLDVCAYFKEYSLLKEKYRDKIDILTGVELGLQPHLSEELNEFCNAYPFDFIIGSTHVVKKADPYYPEFWEQNPSYRDTIMAYLTDTLNNIRSFKNFDVYGHIDYIVRYCPAKDSEPEITDLYKTYPDLIDEILKELIYNGKGIEINTGGLFHLPFANPHKKILMRYRELGGEILTTGSDGHTPDRIANAFDTLPALLTECGFKYTTIFKNRKPEWIKI